MQTIVNAIKTWTIDKIKNSKADWNQNNPEADSYIKNRTHWEEEPVEVEVIAETTITISQDGDPFGILPCPMLKHGQEYIVNWNGVQYTCQAIDLGDGMPILGNSSLFGFGDLGDIGNNEPFFFIPFDEPGWYGVFAVQPGTYTVSMKTFDAPIHHLDPKYIKDMYYEYMAPNIDEVMLEQTVMTENDYAYVDWGSINVNQFLTEGATYIVTWNGVQYTCVAREAFDGTLYIGNQAIAIEANGIPFPELITSNEPFFFCTYEPEGQYGLCIQNAGEYTVSIYGTGEKLTPRKIDVKYMPYEIVGELENHNNWISNLDNALSNKMNKSNPSGTGYFSLNRKSDTARGQYSFAEGYNGTASGYASHAEGVSTVASGSNSHAEGNTTTASGKYSHAEGEDTIASGERSHAEGYKTTAAGSSSHAEGNTTTASEESSHAEGLETTASGKYSHTEGYKSEARGKFSHAEGYWTLASGDDSHAEGWTTIASGSNSHAECNNTEASGKSSHAEGYYTKAVAENSHAEGYSTKASGYASHAEGNQCVAYGNSSHAEAYRTKALSAYQHAQGKFNIADSSDVYAHIVGNGTSDTDRSNAHTLDWDGNAWYQGDVYVGSTSGTNRDEGSKKLATEEYVDNNRVCYEELVTSTFEETIPHIESTTMSTHNFDMPELAKRIFENGDQFTYTITTDNTNETYECEAAWNNQGSAVAMYLYINNRHIFTLTATSTKIYVGKIYGATVPFDDSYYSITISGSYEDNVIHQLDEKFIPDTIARIEDIPSIEGLVTEEYVANYTDEKILNLTTVEGFDSVIVKSSTEGSTKKFKLTIDDSGTLTATEIIE